MSPPPKSDVAFLAEVEEFLDLCDLPTFPSLQALDEDDSRVNTSLTSEVQQGAVGGGVSVRQSKKSQDKKKVDAALKHELEKAKDRKRRCAYRERRRIEKETLHQQVGELTTELTELQKAKEAKRSLTSSAWGMVANRQLQARLNAEAEQRRLCTAIESRDALLQEFRGFVSNCLVSESDTRLDGEDVAETSYQHKRMCTRPSNAEFYEAYLQELSAIYAQTDETLTTYGLDSTDSVWGDPKQHWKEDGKNGYYIFLDKQIMPFDFQETSDKFWEAGRLLHRQEDRLVYDGLGDSENTVAFKFRNTTRLNSGRVVSVLQRVAARRYREDDRVVIVWRSFAEGEGLFTGMHADETGWGVITPSTTTSDTLMRICMRHVPMHFSRSSALEPAVKEFTNLILESGTEDAVEITNALEKLLLKNE